MSDLLNVNHKFYCFKCERFVANLYQHLKQDHSMTVDEYLEWIPTRLDQTKVYRGKK